MLMKGNFYFYLLWPFFEKSSITRNFHENVAVNAPSEKISFHCVAKHWCYCDNLLRSPKAEAEQKLEDLGIDQYRGQNGSSGFPNH